MMTSSTPVPRYRQVVINSKGLFSHPIFCVFLPNGHKSLPHILVYTSHPTKRVANTFTNTKYFNIKRLSVLYHYN